MGISLIVYKSKNECNHSLCHSVMWDKIILNTNSSALKVLPSSNCRNFSFPIMQMTTSFRILFHGHYDSRDCRENYCLHNARRKVKSFQNNTITTTTTLDIFCAFVSRFQFTCDTRLPTAIDDQIPKKCQMQII